jgi:hypothetical protein
MCVRGDFNALHGYEQPCEFDLPQYREAAFERTRFCSVVFAYLHDHATLLLTDSNFLILCVLLDSGWFGLCSLGAATAVQADPGRAGTWLGSRIKVPGLLFGSWRQARQIRNF